MYLFIEHFMMSLLQFNNNRYKSIEAINTAASTYTSIHLVTFKTSWTNPLGALNHYYSNHAKPPPTIPRSAHLTNCSWDEPLPLTQSLEPLALNPTPTTAQHKRFQLLQSQIPTAGTRL